mmetsp:Transcript_26305/g.39122  ORF Transcript_26305/g.39122 Transcript_26305/m.39122 type:complete len:757 (-) Transcript_26305:1283-3553(-)
MAQESVADTLKWVRAQSLERRRQFKRKEEGTASCNEDLARKSCTSATSSFSKRVNDDDIVASIAKGRAVLADAEAHLSLFDEFLVCREDKRIAHSLPLHVAETKALDASMKLKEMICGANLDQSFQRARAIELSENNVSLHEQSTKGNPSIFYSSRIYEVTDHTNDCPSGDQTHTKKVKQKLLKPFNPDQLEGAKRAAIASARQRERLTAAENEASAKREFKALPLPGGRAVESNLFAPTKATLGRVKSKKETEEVGPLRLEVSELFQKNKSNVPILHSHSNHVMSSKQRRRHLIRKMEKHANRKQDVNEKGLDAILDLTNDDNDVALRRDILRLQLALGRRREISAHHREILGVNDDDQSHSSIHSESFELSKIYLLNNGNDFEEENTTFGQYLLIEDDVISCFSNGSTKGNSASLKPLFDRQEKWLAAKNKRTEEARLQKEKEELEHITGRPKLASAKKSWAKAQREHAAAALQDQGEEQRRLEKRCLQFGETLREEVKRAETSTGNVHTKKIKKEAAEMEESLARLEKLSQPKTCRIKPTKKEECNGPVGRNDNTSNERGNVVTKDDEGDKSVAAQKETSFGDMSDKDFRRMIKSLGSADMEEREIKMKHCSHTSPTGSGKKTHKLHAKAFARDEKGSALLQCYGVEFKLDDYRCRGLSKNDRERSSGKSKIEEIDVERTVSQERRLLNCGRKRPLTPASKCEIHEGVMANSSSALDAAEAALHGLMSSSKEEVEDRQRPISRAEIQKMEEKN